MRSGIIIGCCLVAACLVGGPPQASVDIGLNLNSSAPLQWAPVPGLPVYYATNAPARAGGVQRFRRPRIRSVRGARDRQSAA